MRWRKGPRPGAIRAFAVIYLAAALLIFAHGLVTLEETRVALATRLPGFAVSSDTAIVVLSAQLSIAAITLFLVWFVAAPFARWLLLAMALVNAWGILSAVSRLPGADFDFAATMLARLAALVAVGCLFLPGARRWFDHSRGRYAASGG